MKTKFRTGIAMLGALALFAAGCGDDSDSGDDSGSGGQIKVGFAQTGSESGWRSANTESMKEAFSKDNGFDLVFNAADNDPAAQISAVRSFISQGVDAIVIAPIVEDGWDDVLQEAKDADIPVILEDRTVTSSDDLYASWVGLDFKQEGVTAGEWAAENFDRADQDGRARGHHRLGSGQRPRRGLRRGHRRRPHRDDRLADRRLHP